MKRTYIEPQMEVVTLAVSQLLAGSTTKIVVDNETTTAFDQADARRGYFSNWDDDEE